MRSPHGFTHFGCDEGPGADAMYETLQVNIVFDDQSTKLFGLSLGVVNVRTYEVCLHVIICKLWFYISFEMYTTLDIRRISTAYYKDIY